jgi:putative inorganic carbon (HCO3(-)) transporter
MQAIRSRTNRLNPFTHATVFTLVMILPLPILLFSDRFPEWLPLVVVGLLVLVFLLRGLANGRFLGQTPADFPLYIILLLIPLNLWATPDLAVTLPRIYALVANIAIFWAIAAQRDSRWLPFSSWGLLALSLIISAITLLGTNFSGAKFPFVGQAIYNAIPRLWQPFWNAVGMNPNLSGGLLALLWPPAFIFLLKGPGWKLRLAGGITTAILTGMLLLAQSRGALLGVLVAAVILTLILNWRFLFLWLLLGITAVIALYQLVPDFAPADLLNSNAAEAGVATIAGRLEIWSRVIYMIQDFPFTGVGQGMVEPVIDILYPLFLISPDQIFQHAHNIYLQTAAEMGLPALIALLAFFLLLLFLPLKQLRQHPNALGASLTLGLLGTMIVFLIHGMVEVITYAPRGAIIVWGIFGLLTAVATSQTFIQEPE